MWWWFRRQKQKLQVLEGDFHDSFGKVRQDTAVLYQWIDYLYRSHLAHQSTVLSLREQNERLHRLVEELRQQHEKHRSLLTDVHARELEVPSHKIKAVIDEHFPLGQVHDRLKDVEQKLAELHSSKVPVAESSSVMQAVPQSGLKERVFRRVSRNSKEFVKSSLHSLIVKYGQISALQLRDIVVDEQGLCSRSSFYRLLDEVEQEQGVVVEARGKEKFYFSQISQVSKNV